MPTLNQLQCGTDNVKNVGYGDCVLEIQFIAGAIAVPESFIMSQANANDLLTFLNDLTTADIATRIFPIGDFRVLTDGTGDPTFQTFANGSQAFVRDGNNVWTFQFVNGGLCLSNALRSFNSSNYRWLFYDANNLIFGTRKVITDEEGNTVEGIGGIKMDSYYAYPWKPNDGTNVMNTRLRFDYKPEQVNRDIKYVQADFDVSTLEGLQNVAITNVGAAPLGGVVNLQFTAGCSAANLYDLYKNILGAKENYVVYNAETGNAITITSVVSNPGLKAFTFTLDDTDPDYPTSNSGKVIYTMVSPAQLAIAGMPGYEALPLTINRG